MKNFYRNLLISVGVAGLAIGVWYGLDTYISPTDQERSDFTLLVVQTLGVMALAAGGYLTFRRVKAAEDTVRTAQEGQITERFTRAIDQLGSDKLQVRLGGIYALERIAKESERDHRPIMEVLTAFVRAGAPVPYTEPLVKKRTRKRAVGDGRPPPKLAADIQAVLTAIDRLVRTFEHGETECLDLRDADLRGAKLREACLQGAHLDGAHLEGAELNGAHLEGAELNGAHLQRAHLNGAHLEGAELNGAHLEGADLSSARLEGAHLIGAHLEGANLNGANMVTTNLRGAQLKGAVLIYAVLAAANLDGAYLEDVSLVGAELGNAHLEGVDLRRTSGLIQGQIDSANTDSRTIVPDNLSATRPVASD